MVYIKTIAHEIINYSEEWQKLLGYFLHTRVISCFTAFKETMFWIVCVLFFDSGRERFRHVWNWGAYTRREEEKLVKMIKNEKIANNRMAVSTGGSVPRAEGASGLMNNDHTPPNNNTRRTRRNNPTRVQ